MTQVLKNDIISAAYKNIVSFKEFYVDADGVRKETFHFLTKNAKLAGVYENESVENIKKVLMKNSLFYSILKKRVVEIDLSKAVGEFNVVSSLESPYDFGRVDLEDLDDETIALINEFKNTIGSNLSNGLVVLSPAKGAVFLDKDFLKAFLEDNKIEDLCLGDFGKAEVLNCVYDSRLARNNLNIYISRVVLNKENTEAEEVVLDPQVDSVEDSGCSLGEQEVEQEEISLTKEEQERELEEDLTQNDSYGDWGFRDDDDNDDFCDDDNYIELNPEISLVVSFDKSSGDVSFEVKNEMDDDRIQNVLKMTEIASIVSRENALSKGMNFSGGLVFDGEFTSDLFNLKDSDSEFEEMSNDDYYSLVADTIAYNVMYGMLTASTEIALDFSEGDNYCVHDFALDESISIQVDINTENFDTTVIVNATDNQVDYIGSHWSITNIMKNSLITWCQGNFKI